MRISPAKRSLMEPKTKQPNTSHKKGEQIMKKMFNKIRKNLVKAGATALAVLMAFGTIVQTNTVTSQAAGASVVYKVHGANYGWQGERSNGQLAGTEGQSLQMECFTAYLTGIGGSIKYRVHVQDYGWMGWTNDNRPAGTTGEGRRIEAIEMKLEGEAASRYDIEYRSHCQNVGWTPWIRSGVSGTTGQSLRMEAIQVRLVAKAGAVNNGGGSSSVNVANLQNQYPNGSYWNGSYKNKAWECHGFACMIADKLTGSDPYTWGKKYNLNSLKAGDVVRFSRPHSILVTAVSGDTVTYVDCNWVGANTVQWNQTCSKAQLTGRFGSLSYVMSR